MTLIVGMKCLDGVVVAADSAADVESAKGRSTIHHMKKITACADPCHALGVAGTTGTSQQYGLAARVALGDVVTFQALHPVAAMNVIADHFRTAIESDAAHIAWRAKTESRKPEKQDLRDIAAEALVAVRVSGEARLYHFNQATHGCEVTIESPYAIIGDGDAAAIPFLQYLRLEVLGNEAPSIPEAVAATLWTVRYAIKVQHKSIGGTVQMVTLSNEGKLRELDAAEIEETAELITAAEGSMRELRRKIRGFTDEPAALPTPPSSGDSSKQEERATDARPLRVAVSPHD